MRFYIAVSLQQQGIQEKEKILARWLTGWVVTLTSTAMNNQIDRYQKIKRQAMQLMLNGDVQQYMRALRLMSRITLQRS